MPLPPEFEAIFRENLERLEKENPIPVPPIRDHIELVQFQMQDMEERVSYLEQLLECRSFSSKADPDYKRIMEYSVKFALDLDSINVTGRDEIRAERKKLLARLEQVSTNLFKSCK